jgi:hypothetical protein
VSEQGGQVLDEATHAGQALVGEALGVLTTDQKQAAAVALRALPRATSEVPQWRVSQRI